MLSYSARLKMIEKGRTIPAGFSGITESLEFSLLSGKVQTPTSKGTKSTNQKRKKNNKRNKRKGK